MQFLLKHKTCQTIIIFVCAFLADFSRITNSLDILSLKYYTFWRSLSSLKVLETSLSFSEKLAIFKHYFQCVMIRYSIIFVFMMDIELNETN